MIWIAADVELTSEARAAIVERNLHVSVISAWEVANLVRKERLVLAMSPAIWFRNAMQKMEATMSDLTIDILVDSCFLPGSPPSDPADRMIIATTRQAGLAILTRDEKILAYSRAGHVQALAC